MYSNSFKRFIEFSESEQKPIQASAKKRINEQIEQKETATISEITDKELMQIIIPLMSKNKVLQAVDETSKYYEKKHKNMTFREWYKLVSELYKKMKT
jgi:hypothetical protein